MFFIDDYAILVVGRCTALVTSARTTVLTVPVLQQQFCLGPLSTHVSYQVQPRPICHWPDSQASDR